MKSKDITVDEILQALLNPEHSLSKGGKPVSPEERTEAHEAMLNIVKNDVLTRCVACDAELSIRKTTACACGGFVCDACRLMETEGVCDHERPILPDDDEDD